GTRCVAYLLLQLCGTTAHKHLMPRHRPAIALPRDRRFFICFGTQLARSGRVPLAVECRLQECARWRQAASIHVSTKDSPMSVDANRTPRLLPTVDSSRFVAAAVHSFTPSCRLTILTADRTHLPYRTMILELLSEGAWLRLWWLGSVVPHGDEETM